MCLIFGFWRCCWGNEEYEWQLSFEILFLEERSEQPIESLKCSMCLKGFDEEKDYQDHLQKNHPEWMETDGTHCSICKRDFPSTLSLKMHAEREHFVRLRYKCPHCSESFNQQRPLYLVSCLPIPFNVDWTRKIDQFTIILIFVFFCKTVLLSVTVAIKIGWRNLT